MDTCSGYEWINEAVPCLLANKFPSRCTSPGKPSSFMPVARINMKIPIKMYLLFLGFGRSTSRPKASRCRSNSPRVWLCQTGHWYSSSTPKVCGFNAQSLVPEYAGCRTIVTTFNHWKHCRAAAWQWHSNHIAIMADDMPGASSIQGSTPPSSPACIRSDNIATGPTISLGSKAETDPS